MLYWNATLLKSPVYVERVSPEFEDDWLYLVLIFGKLKNLPIPEWKKAAGQHTELPDFAMVGDVGLEPTASGSGDQRSIQLS